MAVPDQESWRSYGSLETLPADDRPEWGTLRHHFRLQRWRWMPGPQVRDDLPGGFSLELLCCLGADGQRRLIPARPAENFVLEAALGGLALLSARRRWSPQQRRGYRTMHLLYRRVRELREHLGRDFGWSRDLYVRESARVADEDRNVLPEDLGRAADGTGHRWSIQQLIDRGRELAVADGMTDPTRPQLISYGLFAAAQRNPLHVPPAEIPNLVRLALFAPPPPDKVPDADADVIEARLLTAIDAHLADGIEEFQVWFRGPHNSLLKQIAKQRNEEGGPFPMSAVRKVLLNLGWKSYCYVAQCVDAQMRFVEAAIQQPLTASEKRLFDLTFLEQAFLADLPLVLITERIPALKVALRLCAPGEEFVPDETLHPIGHRLLYYYQQMASARREADQRSQRRTRGRRRRVASD